MALLLAADTSTSVNTVALCDCARKGMVELRAETVVECARGHAERLVETVDWVLSQGGARLEAVELFAVSIGPGSFTGLRIGVATWKGLAFATGKPLYGVPTLDALARASGVPEGLVCPMIDAKMGEVYGAVYSVQGEDRETIQPAQAAPVEQLLGPFDGPIHFLGDGALRYRGRIEAILPEARFASAWQSVPRASAVAAEAMALIAAGNSGDADAAAPVYLRQAKVNARGVIFCGSGKGSGP